MDASTVDTSAPVSAEADTHSSSAVPLRHFDASPGGRIGNATNAAVELPWLFLRLMVAVAIMLVAPLWALLGMR